MIQAEYTGSNNSLVCMPEADNFGYVSNSSVRVLWTGPGVEYYLETEIVPVPGILIYYSCMYMYVDIFINSDIVQLFCFGWSVFIMFISVKYIITGLWMV